MDSSPFSFPGKVSNQNRSAPENSPAESKPGTAGLISGVLMDTAANEESIPPTFSYLPAADKIPGPDSERFPVIRLCPEGKGSRRAPVSRGFLREKTEGHLRAACRLSRPVPQQVFSRKFSSPTDSFILPRFTPFENHPVLSGRA